jgi:TolB-like protein/DNA-binding winged helix-turn-helix (wHTH) protein
LQNDYKLGDWTIHPERGCIERSGRIVHLKPKAMAVLNCLAEAAGGVVGRDTLFDEVWPGQAISDATLTQCVVELRNALGDSARDPEYIETIPKAGFRLLQPVEPAASGSALPGAGARPLLRRRALVLMLVVVAVVAAAVTWFADERQTRPDTGADAVSTLAVLPFIDLSAAGDQAYLAHGLSEELIDRLSRLEGLAVAARTASFRFRDRGLDLPAVAGALQVRYLLEGSVRRDSDELRVTASLVDAEEGFRLWSDVYERPLGDIFEVQAEIAEAVAVALSITLKVGDLGRAPGGTSSIEAYEAYLRALALHREFDRESMLKAIEELRRAVEIDPQFGQAWIYLARLYREIEQFHGGGDEIDWLDRWDEALSRAEALVERELDTWPGVEWAVKEERLFILELERQWIAAQELLGPLPQADGAGHPEAFDYAYFLYHVGRVRESIPLMERWRRLHPNASGVAIHLATTYGATGKFEAAFAEAERATAIPGYGEHGPLTGMIVAMGAGDANRLAHWLERRIAVTEADYRGFLEFLAESIGQPGEALPYLQATMDATDRYDYDIALWAAWHGDEELALQALRRSNGTFAFWLPHMAPVRRTPGFVRLVEDFGLVDYWRAYEWGDFCRPANGAEVVCE